MGMEGPTANAEVKNWSQRSMVYIEVKKPPGETFSKTDPPLPPPVPTFLHLSPRLVLPLLPRLPPSHSFPSPTLSRTLLPPRPPLHQAQGEPTEVPTVVPPVSRFIGGTSWLSESPALGQLGSCPGVVPPQREPRMIDAWLTRWHSHMPQAAESWRNDLSRARALLCPQGVGRIRSARADTARLAFPGASWPDRETACRTHASLPAPSLSLFRGPRTFTEGEVTLSGVHLPSQQLPFKAPGLPRQIKEQELSYPKFLCSVTHCQLSLQGERIF